MATRAEAGARSGWQRSGGGSRGDRHPELCEVAWCPAIHGAAVLTPLMRILFLHQNFPGQFRHIAAALQQGRHELLAVTPDTNKQAHIVPVRTYRFDPKSAQTSVQLAARYTECVVRGAAAAAALGKIRKEGFTPDIVIGHAGWGETLFVRDVWPDCRILAHAGILLQYGGQRHRVRSGVSRPERRCVSDENTIAQCKHGACFDRRQSGHCADPVASKPVPIAATRENHRSA